MSVSGSADKAARVGDFEAHTASLPMELRVAALRLWPRVPPAQKHLLTDLVKAYCRLRDDAVLTLATGEEAHLRSALDDLGEPDDARPQDASSGVVFVNASTPERLHELALAAAEAFDTGDYDVMEDALREILAVRVEEPAGEPEPAEPMDEYVERVAQSANADVVERCEAKAAKTGDVSCQCLLEKSHSGDHRCPHGSWPNELPTGLPVPVGDETEALRAEVARLEQALSDARYLGDNHHNAAACPYCGDLLGKALARVAGLEAREASLRDALEDIVRNESQPSGAGYRIGQLLAALADSGEAGS